MSDAECIETENEVIKKTSEHANVIDYDNTIEEYDDHYHEAKDLPQNVIKIQNKPRQRHSSQPGMPRMAQRPSRPNRVSLSDIDNIKSQAKYNRRQTGASGTNGLRMAHQVHGPQRLQYYPETSTSNYHTENEIMQRPSDRNSLPENIDLPEINSNNFSGLNKYTNSVSTVDGMSRTQNNSDRQHKVSTAMSMRSIDLLPSTSDDEKDKLFSRTLATILSCIYGVIIVTLGAIISVADIFVDRTLAEIYCMYLIVIGFAYLIFLLIDIRVYITKAKKYHKHCQNELQNEMDGSIHSFPNTAPKNSRKDPKPPESPEHFYCFAQGRHAGSYYLKLGAACFCLGHLVHSALFLNMQIVYLTSDESDECAKIEILIMDIIYPIYSFCQLFFIFKYSNVIILRNKVLGRFAIMHCISSSIVFWVWTIVREVMESLTIYAKKSSGKYDEYLKTYYNDDSTVMIRPLNLPLSLYRTAESDYLRSIFNFTSLADNNCSTSHGFDGIIENIFPYLYPFTIEYSILIVGIFYIIWQNIGHCSKDGDSVSHNEHSHKQDDWESYKSVSNDPDHCKIPSGVDDDGIVNNLVINIDCHSSHKGWFAGLIVVVASIVSVIVSYVAISSEDLVKFGVMAKDVSELVLHLVMLIAAVAAYMKIRKLDVNQHPVSLLDDLLLFICIPAFFFDASFSFVPALIYGNYLKIFTIIVVILQVLVQTPLIIDALRRCSNTRELRRLKHGRELITFLIVCNVSTWIFVTFSIKNAETDDERYDFYGKVLWTILGHISVPLCMFYRFHSSVCLADIWKCAYEPGNSH